MARVQRMWALAQGVFYGLSLGSVLLLAAAGLAITFGVMGVINMAHGEMVMLGAYTTFWCSRRSVAMRRHSPASAWLLAVPAAFLVPARVGIADRALLIRFLYGRPLETLLATWGLSLVLQQAVRSIFGANNRDVAYARLDERRRAIGRSDASPATGCTSSCSRCWCWRR